MAAPVVDVTRLSWGELIATAAGIVAVLVGLWATHPALVLVAVGAVVIDGAQRAAIARGERPE